MTNKINYQGILKEGGIPVAGSRSMEFKIWDSMTGGKLLWTSGKQTIQVTEGVFSVMIGPDGSWPFDWSDPNLTPYLETLVEGQVLGPRETLASVPFAMAANTIPSLSSDKVKLTGTQVSLSGWQSSQDPTKISASAILGTIPGSASPLTHASTHRTGGNDAVQLTPSQIDGTALVSQSNGDQTLSGNLTITGTLNGVQSNAVKLTGSNALLSSWQAGSDPTKMDSSKILGSTPPGPHATAHRTGGSDVVQLTPTQIDGIALVTSSSATQTLKGDLAVTGNLAVSGSISGTEAKTVKLTGSSAYLSSWQSSLDATKIDSSKIQGAVPPGPHAITHRTGGSDVVQLTPSQIDGTALVSQSTGDQTLNGNLTVTGTLNGVQSNAIKLTGSNAFLSSWQSASDATKIDSSKIQGTVPPGPHAATHRTGSSDAVQLTPSQIDGTALVANSSTAQTIQPTANVVALTLQGNANSTAKVLSIFDSNSSPAEQIFVDYAGNITLHKGASIDGNLTVGGTVTGVQSNTVKLSGSSAFLSSWQSGSDATKIDSSKIQGTIPPGPHAASHRTGGGDAVQLSPAQIDGTALVTQPSSDQTLQGNLNISKNLTVSGNITISGEDVQSHLIPSGMIAMFDHSCPSGWTRVSDLDGRFPQGSSSYGGTGGSATHSHTVNSHTHSISGMTANAALTGSITTYNQNFQVTDGQCEIGVGSNASIQSPTSSSQHNHSISLTSGAASPGTDSQSNIPPYLNVIWCKKN